MKRLFIAWLAAVAATFLLQVATLVFLTSGRYFPVFMIIATLIAITLAIVTPLVYAPAIRLLQQLSPRVGRLAAAATGALLTPVPMLALWLAYRERGESWNELAGWIGRMPQETFATAVPLMIGGMVFCILFARGSAAMRSH
jgi:hypothetical protein